MNYKKIQLYSPTSKKLFEATKEEYKKFFDVSKFKFEEHPQEDSFFSSKNLPIFSVADGVTLEINSNKKYMNPSSAFLVADKFVKTIIPFLEKNYKTINTKQIKNAFKKGNTEAQKINKKFKRNKQTTNYLDFDLFCATAATGLIKNDKLYWFTIADSFIAIFDKFGKQKFLSPNGWRFIQIPKQLIGTEKRIYIRKCLRNGFKNDEKIGYGVISGEPKAIKYLDCGIEKIKKDDIIFIGTDGYEEYVKLNNFIKLFINWDKNTKQQIKKLEDKLIKKDVRKYSHERTLFVIKH